MKEVKASCRQRLRAAVASLGAAERAAAERAIGDALLALIDGREPVPRVVALYAAYKREVDIGGVARALAARGVEVVWPRVMAPGAMELAAVAADALVPGFRGILEPAADAPPTPLEVVDLIVVPGVGFDRVGHRLGQGGGYYDRLLVDPRRRGLAVGVGFSVQLIDRVPAAPHDVALDAVVTERGVSWTATQGPPRGGA